MSKEATIIQNFNAEKRKYEYFVKGYDVTKSIKILLKRYKEEYDKERRVFESTKGYLEAQQEYEKHIANLQSQLDQANEKIMWLIKLNNEVVINKGKEIFDLRVQVLQQKQNQIQLAIQELEKVKEYMNSEYGYDCCVNVSIVDEFIDNQIKELKGEKYGREIDNKK